PASRSSSVVIKSWSVEGPRQKEPSPVPAPVRRPRVYDGRSMRKSVAAVGSAIFSPLGPGTFVGLMAYPAALWPGIAAFVRWYEEPTLLPRLSTEYAAYRRAVPAWRPRLRPWRG